MGKVLPTGWQMVLSSTVPELAGGGDRAAALRTLDHALLRKPGDPWLAIAQAQVYMQIADFQRALGLLDGALAGPTTAADRRAALFCPRPRQLRSRPLCRGGRRFRRLPGGPHDR